MKNIQILALTHVALLILFVGCLSVAQRPGLQAFYFLAGMLCIPVLGSLRELFNAVKSHIQKT